ncbi:hypothetical protein BV924_00135 [Pectobacterium odoriferum]|uniref:Uncharacterized protein n=2 Tax=Pectobacterium odoriferum TaxID=78398 RepID=A0ABD6VVW3_9GAMM|nr:hypothetical protein [Pectobacterium odoriferum]POD97213.1 hypothetical protein BVY06_07860 [Pectobacterium odoriferum]POE15227.1 hypothetical protein BV924_00135 [Pectobacterium odoriferum]POE28764.1 hypothetical protein BV926_00135 [Pectobacterium odoriferum]POE34114.1 hypothetical protein BV919_00135 [Pectobacterium odoriferum]POE41105.1 hypothetical protein BV920_08060 [Pectobacterium odoriferum]
MMRIQCLILALLPSLALADGALVMQPQPDGSLIMLTEGTASTGEKGVFTFMQKAGKSLTVQAMPSGGGHCAGSALALESLQLTFAFAQEGSRLSCGESVLLDGPEQPRRVSVRVENNAAMRSVDWWGKIGDGLRQQIGSVSFRSEGEGTDVYSLYLDLSVLKAQSPTLTASFEKPDIRLGMVGDIHDVNAVTKLRISKTRQAENSVIPYALTFESSQKKDYQYRLRTSSNGEFIPYRISVGGKEVGPSSAYHGQIPAGEMTSDVLNVQFSLLGRDTRGIDAGERLLDTVTAVITPKS